MRVVILDEVGKWGAWIVAKKILDEKPSKENPLVLCLSVGKTSLSLYQRLIEYYKDGIISFQNVVVFGVQEFIGISSRNMHSYHYYIWENFLKQIDIELSNIHLLDGMAKDPIEESKRFEKEIEKANGIDLAVISTSSKGSLGFNEAGSSLASRTRPKTLTEDTISHLSDIFGSEEDVPRQALTLGLGTLFDAKEIVVLMKGYKKAEAVSYVLEGSLNHMWGATVLQNHEHATLVVNEKACYDLKHSTYIYFKKLEKDLQDVHYLSQQLYIRMDKKKEVKLFVDATIFDGNSFLKDYFIVVKNDMIIGVFSNEEMSFIQDKYQENTKIYSLKDKIIAPGFIDLQHNGCVGHSFQNDLKEENLLQIKEDNYKHGTLSYLPTLITTTDDRMYAFMDFLDDIPNLEDFGILGYHIEGPYISKEKHGIHTVDYIRKPSKEMIHRIIESKTAIVTLAPEEVDFSVIEELNKAGIHVSMGHTNATKKQVLEKIPAGLHMATHLYNAMSALSSREPGVVGAILDSDSIYAGIIVDGEHCDYASVQIAQKILKEHLFLITDMIALVDSDLKYFDFETRRVYKKGDKALGEDGTLGGSLLTLDQAVRNMIKEVGVPPEEALKMASTYPAKAINVDYRYGYLKKNYIADMVVLDKNYQVDSVIVKGNYKNIS